MSMPFLRAAYPQIVSPDMTASTDMAATIAGFIDRKIRLSSRSQAGPLIAGLCGAQGIGKSTVSVDVAAGLEARGHRTLILALDDLYLPQDERVRLAETVHPLLETRGVPGTHDIELGLALLHATSRRAPLALPRFDKAIDDRLPRDQWPVVESRPAAILFEGWCVGATAQPEQELVEPVNELERLEDADCIWRRYVNDALERSYQRLFAKLDTLILLAAPSFEIVATWRRQQETHLRREFPSPGDLAKTMSTTEVDRFVLHYERLTRHILREMPDRADLVLHLDTQRKLMEIAGREATLLEPWPCSNQLPIVRGGAPKP
jgi:D-glycerate 3-kinase